jgi:hypothetical protein
MVFFFAKVMVFNLYQGYALNQVLYFHCSINIYPSFNATPSRICLLSNIHVYQTFPRNMHTKDTFCTTTIVRKKRGNRLRMRTRSLPWLPVMVRAASGHVTSGSFPWRSPEIILEPYWYTTHNKQDTSTHKMNSSSFRSPLHLDISFRYESGGLL